MGMAADTHARRFLLRTFSGWVNRHQQDVIAYLVDENRVLREHLGDKCPKLNDGQRRRLAALAKLLGRQVLDQVATRTPARSLTPWAARWPEEHWKQQC